jgi:CMP-N-acetylneuraminic acid synthetase
LVPFVRPAEPATDAATTTDTIVHLFDGRNKNGQMDPELIMVLQPTSPFRSGFALAQAIELIRKRDDVDSVVGMKGIDRPAIGLFLVDHDKLATSICSDDEPAPIYIANGTLFVTKTAMFRR